MANSQKTFSELLNTDPSEFVDKYQFDPEALEEVPQYNLYTKAADKAADAAYGQSKAFSESKGIADSTFGEQLATQAQTAAREPFIEQQANVVQDLSNKQFAAEQFGISTAMDQAKLDETVRQYNENVEIEKSQWADKFGLDQGQFEEFVRQYNNSDDIERERYANTLQFDRERFDESIRQFDISAQLQRDTLGEQKRSARKDEGFGWDDAIGLAGTAALMFSDETLKKNITPITESLEIVNNINPVGFTWKNDNHPDYGVIAQEIEKILPQIVFDQPNGLKKVNYTSMIPFLIKAIQELDSKIKRLEGEK